MSRVQVGKPISTFIYKQIVQTIGYKMIIFVLRFFLILMLAHVFTPSEYGAYSLIMTAYTFGMLFSGLNLYTYLSRVIPGHIKENRLSVFKTTFLFEVGLTMILVIIFIGSGAMNPVLTAMKIVAYKNAFLVGLILLIALVASTEITTYLRAKIKIEQSNLTDFIVQAVWIVPLLLIWYMGRHLTVMSVFLANLGGIILGIAYGFLHVEIKEWWRARFNMSILREALTYSAPLIVPAISVTALRSGDRFILSYYHNLYDVGLYSFAYNFLNTIYTFSAVVIFGTMVPYIVQAHNLSNFERRNKLLLNALKFSMAMFGGGALILILFSKPIFQLIARPEFLGVREILPLLSVGYLSVILAYPAHSLLLLQNRTMLLMWIDLFGFLVGMCLSFALIPRYSYYGAIWTMAVTFTLVAVVKIFYTQLWKQFSLKDLFSLGVTWGNLKDAN